MGCKPESAMVLSRGFIAFVLAIATTIAAPTQDTVVPETSLTELKESPPLPGAFSAKAHDGDSANAALSEVAPLEKPQSVVPMTSLLGMVRHSKGYTLEAIQADARTLSSTQSAISKLSEEQRHVGTTDLALDKSLSDHQVDAVLAIQMLAEKWNNQMRPGYVPREHDVVVTIRTALRGIEAKLETARTEAVSEEDEKQIKKQQDIIDSMKEQLNKLTKITSAPSFSPTPAPTDEFAFKMSSVGIGCCSSPGWTVQEQGVQTVQECKLRCLKDPNCGAMGADMVQTTPTTTNSGPNDTGNCHLYYSDDTSTTADCVTTSAQGLAESLDQQRCYSKENADFKFMKIRYPPTCPSSSPFLRCGQSGFTITRYMCVTADGGEEVDTASCSHLAKPRDYAENCTGSNGCVEGYAEYAGYNCPSTDGETEMSFNDPLLAGLDDVALCKAQCDNSQTCASFQFDALKGVCRIYGSKCAGDQILPGCDGCEASSIYVKRCACNSKSVNFLVPGATLASSELELLSILPKTDPNDQDTCVFASTDHPTPNPDEPDAEAKAAKENAETERKKRDAALSDKEIACTTKVMFTQNLDDLEGHHCLEDVLDYTTDTNYINTKSACDNAKSDLIAANEVLDLAEERSACASEKAYYFWMKAEGLTFRNFQGCKLGTRVLTKNREYTDSY